MCAIGVVERLFAEIQIHAGLLTVNLGMGRPVSVLEMVRSFERASGRAVPYRVVVRRTGDVAQCWADPALARRRGTHAAINTISKNIARSACIARFSGSKPFEILADKALCAPIIK